MNIASTVLVVEDEALIRITIADALREIGIQVHEAADASQALALMERYDTIRLVFTDIDMPGGMDGLELSRIVRDRWPPVLIIVASGMQRPRSDQLPAGAKFYGKPYVAEDIAESVRSILAA